MTTEAMKAARKALSDRSFRLALLGYVPEDDPEIVADMQNRIDQLEAQLDSALSSVMVLAKRPVAWRVKDFADGWILYQNEERAIKEADENGCVIQGLYVRDGTPFSSDMVMVPRELTEEMIELAARAEMAHDYSFSKMLSADEKQKHYDEHWPKYKARVTAVLAAALRQRQGGDGE